ncbi:MAG: queuosine salvage family protein [Candidatus Micrarchaeia archaeon]
MASKEKEFVSGRGVFRQELYDAAESIELMAEDVEIDYVRLLDFAKEHAFSEVSLPKWDLPVFLEKADDATLGFMILGNTQNFAFTDFITKKKYFTDYEGSNYSGAMGMWASLKKAIEKGVPLLDGGYLSTITYKELESIYNGKSKIPMLQDRLEILNEVGDVLCKRYEGRFHNIVAGYEEGKARMFDNGKGFVERLISDFPSFRDESEYKGIKIRFEKRAQLAAGMIYEKFKGLGKKVFAEGEETKLSVFPDYELPKALRSIGIFKYSNKLQEEIDEGVPLKSGGNEEVELRAATVYVADLLEETIKHFNPSSKINQLWIDYLLWSAGRNSPGNSHLTITTAY